MIELIYTNAYSTNVQNNVIVVTGKDIPICPCCGGKLLKNGSRLRNAINLEKENRYCLRRFRCKICNRTHHELPSCLLPRKRYETEVYEHIITGQLDGIECDEKTIAKIQRWGISLLKQYLMMSEPSYQSKMQVDALSTEKYTALLSGVRLPAKGWLYILVNQSELKI
jgi:hypothetical protein